MGKITHVMADGTVRDSIDGVEIPLTPRTRRYYELLAEEARKNMAKEQPKTNKKGR